MEVCPTELLQNNGFKGIKFYRQDDELFYASELVFDADVFDCIRANQIMVNNGIEVSRCGLDLNIVDGVLEKPHGSITFFRNEVFCS
jgi:hypothetical protein